MAEKLPERARDVILNVRRDDTKEVLLAALELVDYEATSEIAPLTLLNVDGEVARACEELDKRVKRLRSALLAFVIER